jgi:hypothetical protein
MIDVLSVILLRLINQPLMTCSIGSCSPHLGNSQMVDFDSSILHYSLNDSSLLEMLFNINSTIDVHNGETAFQPAGSLSLHHNGQSPAFAASTAQLQSMLAYNSLPHSAR